MAPKPKKAVVTTTTTTTWKDPGTLGSDEEVPMFDESDSDGEAPVAAPKGKKKVCRPTKSSKSKPKWPNYRLPPQQQQRLRQRATDPLGGLTLRSSSRRTLVSRAHGTFQWPRYFFFSFPGFSSTSIELCFRQQPSRHQCE